MGDRGGGHGGGRRHENVTYGLNKEPTERDLIWVGLVFGFFLAEVVSE